MKVKRIFQILFRKIIKNTKNTGKRINGRNMYFEQKIRVSKNDAAKKRRKTIPKKRKINGTPLKKWNAAIKQ